MLVGKVIQPFCSLAKSPLLWQEIRRLLRSQKSYWLLFGFLSALLYVVIRSWSEFASAFAPDGDIAQGSRNLFYKLAQGHILFVTLFTPFLMAPSIAAERESQTFHLLVSSPISLIHLILAKLLSPMLFVILLMISGIPVLSLSFIGGGLAFDEVFQTYCILLAATVTFGLLGLFCSTLRRRIYEVYLLAALATLFFVLLLPFHGSVWSYVNDARMVDMGVSNHNFQFLSPFFALREEFYPSSSYRDFVLKFYHPYSSDVTNAQGTTTSNVLFAINGVFAAYLGVSAIVCAALLFLILYRVRKIAYETGTELDFGQMLREFAKTLQQYSIGLRFVYILLVGIFVYGILINFSDVWNVVGNVLSILIVHFVFKGMEYLAEDEEEPDQTELEDYYDRDYDLSFTAEAGNPGLFLERRVQWFARSAVLLRLTYLALMISILMLPLVSYDGSWLYLSLPFVVAAFFTLPLAATSISSDRERGTLDLLRTTLLSSEQIVHAKYSTNLQYSFMIAIALYIPGLLILTFFAVFTDYDLDLVYKTSDLLILLWYPVLLYSALVLYTSIGVYCSAYFNRTNKALLISALVIVLCLLGPSPVPALNVANLSLGPGGGGIGLSVISPLAIMTLLFPEGRVNLLGRAVEIPEALGNAAWGLAILQCVASLIVARYLYRSSMKVLQR